MNSAGTRSTPCTRTAMSCRSRISWCTLVTTMPSWAAISGTGTNVGVVDTQHSLPSPLTLS